MNFVDILPASVQHWTLTRALDESGQYNSIVSTNEIIFRNIVRWRCNFVYSEKICAIISGVCAEICDVHVQIFNNYVCQNMRCIHVGTHVHCTCWNVRSANVRAYAVMYGVGKTISLKTAVPLIRMDIFHQYFDICWRGIYPCIYLPNFIFLFSANKERVHQPKFNRKRRAI